MRVVSRLNEAGDEPRPVIVSGTFARMNADHSRVAAERLRVAGRAAKYLCPVRGEIFDVAGADPL
jgi:hypothetical protein